MQVEKKIDISAFKKMSSDTEMILEQLHAIVTVYDLESNKVLYMNSYAKRIFGNLVGKPCYDFFQNVVNIPHGSDYDEYQKIEIKDDNVLIRDYFNVQDDKWYEVQDKLIYWIDGRKVKLEVAYDINHRKDDEKKLLILYKQQEIFSQIATSFNHEEAFANKVNNVIGLVGNFIGVNRVSIFENQGIKNQTKLTYEWCGSGIKPKIDRLPVIKYSPEQAIYKQVITDKLLAASDLEDEIYRLPFAALRRFDVRAMLLIPIYLHGKHKGFINFEMCNQIRIWQKSEIQFIKTFANIISTSFERKDIEEKRIRSELNLREANATKDKFFSIITKNLLTPFLDLTSLSTILLNNFQKWDDNKRLKFIQSIKESSVQGFKLLENLMIWSKMQSGLMEFNKQKVDLRSVINLTIEQLKEKAEQKNITISGAPEDFVFVFADYMMLNTIFKNLILNALKFTPANGRIVISLRETFEFVQIDICDNGIGIEKTYLNSLFRIDLDNSSFGPPEEKGTGLGLIICREFVERNGGQIWAESEFGVGSCFKFTIPRLNA